LSILASPLQVTSLDWYICSFAHIHHINDLERPLTQYILRHITKKCYKIELFLQWQTNSKWYIIYWVAPHSATLNDPYTRFHSHTMISCWISRERYEIDTVSMEYYTLLNSVILTDLEQLSKVFDDTKRRAVSLCQLSFLLQSFAILHQRMYMTVFTA